MLLSKDNYILSFSNPDIPGFQMVVDLVIDECVELVFT